MIINVFVSKVNPSGPGMTDGSITMVIQSVSPVPPDLSTTFRYFTINNGTSFQINGYLNTRVYTGLGAGTYTCFVQMQPSGDSVPSFSIPQEIFLSDGSTPDDPDAFIYKDVYHGEFCDKNGDNINIDIQRYLRNGDPDPTITDIIFAGEEPVTIDYSYDEDYKQNPITGTECKIKVKADGTFQLSSLYTTSETEWRVVIYGAWNWTGFVIPDSCTEPYMFAPYDVEFSVTDRLGTLKDRPFQNDDLTNIVETYSDLQMLQIALAKTGLDLPIIIAVNTREANMSIVGNGGCPVTKTFISGRAFINDERIPVDCYEVIRSIVERWSCRLFQWDGYWYMVNVLEQSTGPVNAWEFQADGTYVGMYDIGDAVTAGEQYRDVQPVGKISIAKGQKSSTVRYIYGYESNQFYNGDFDIWTSKPTGLPDSWSAVGGITASTGTRQVDGVDTTDHYLIIGNNTATGYVQNDNTVQVRANEKATLSFDYYSQTAMGAVLQDIYVRVVIHDTTNDRYFTPTGWKPAPGGGSFIVYKIRRIYSDFKMQLAANIDIEAQDGDYSLQFAVLAIQDSGSNLYSLFVNNVAISQGVTQAVIKPGIALEHKQTTTYSINYTKDPIKILHNSEPLDTERTSGITIETSSGAAAPTTWARTGISETQTLEFIIANSELINHQVPYRIFEGLFVDAYKVGLGALTLLTLDRISPIGLPNSAKFIFLSGTFRLKEGNHDLRFAEAVIYQMPLLVPGGETKEIYET